MLYILPYLRHISHLMYNTYCDIQIKDSCTSIHLCICLYYFYFLYTQVFYLHPLDSYSRKYKTPLYTTHYHHKFFERRKQPKHERNLRLLSFFSILIFFFSFISVSYTNLTRDNLLQLTCTCRL